MATIARNTKAAGGTDFTSNTNALASEVNADFNTVVAAWNAHDAGSSKWTVNSSLNASATPLIADNSSGTNNIAELKDNGTAVVTVADGGTVTFAPGGTTKVVIGSSAVTLSNSQTLAMGSAKITGLANGSAATDALAFGQMKVIQAVYFTTTSTTTVTAASFTNTVLTSSITPLNSSSTILILACGQFRVAGASYRSFLTFNRAGTTNVGDSTNGITEMLGDAGSQHELPLAMIASDAPGTTSATSYTLQMKSDGSNSTIFNNQGAKNFLILLEVQP